MRVRILMYLAAQKIGEIKPRRFQKMLIKEIFPTLEPLDGVSHKASISITMAQRWLQRLGYTRHSTKKGVYVDGHERPDVLKAWEDFLAMILEYQK